MTMLGRSDCPNDEICTNKRKNSKLKWLVKRIGDSVIAIFTFLNCHC